MPEFFSSGIFFIRFFVVFVGFLCYKQTFFDGVVNDHRMSELQ